MNKTPHSQALCETLMAHAKEDRHIYALCSDSRGSASMTPFFNAFPEQSIEVGIAEQNLVSIAAGMAHCGEKPYCFSPACFISTRSYEQAKVDVAYSNTNVKLIGISGGISYGGLLQDEKLAYVRVGRNPVEDIYSETDCPFEMDRATVHGDLEAENDVAIIACGEMVRPALEAAKILQEKGIKAVVADMYCVKPLDQDTVIKAAKSAKLVITVEEHAPYGGMGSAVAVTVGENCPKKVITMTLPDDHVITGKSAAVFYYYGLIGEGIAKKAVEELR